MKAGWVSSELLGQPLEGVRYSSFRASDYLCREDAVEKEIVRLEKHLAGTQTALLNKKIELAMSRYRENNLISAGKLGILGESS